MKAAIRICFATILAAAVQSGVRAQPLDSYLLPVEVKCPLEGMQTYSQVFEKVDGLTIRYVIKLDGDKPTHVAVEVAKDGPPYRIVEQINMVDPATSEEKRSLGEALFEKNKPAFDAICSGPSAEKDRYQERLEANTRRLIEARENNK